MSETKTVPKQSSIEDIMLRYSARGMTVLREYMKKDFCKEAADRILALERGTVLLTTGFYVNGHAETDGPPGAFILAKALQKLGFSPIMITDDYCRNLFESEKIPVEYVPVNSDSGIYRELLTRYQPVCLISVERCGKTAEKDYINMRGISIASKTAPIDTMFDLARSRGILTVGIGDGGNEIGMGNLKDVIARKLQFTPWGSLRPRGLDGNAGGREASSRHLKAGSVSEKNCTKRVCGRSGPEASGKRRRILFSGGKGNPHRSDEIVRKTSGLFAQSHLSLKKTELAP